MTSMTIQEALQHAGSAIDCGSIRDRALEVIPHYMWTEGNVRNRRGFCTACLQWCDELKDIPRYVVSDPYAEDYAAQFETPYRCENTLDTNEYNEKVTGKSRHLDYGWCPICGARVQFRSLAMGRKNVWDKVYLIAYSKSKIEENAVVCVGYVIDVPWGVMDEYESLLPPIDLFADELCVFRYGKGGDRFIRVPESFDAVRNGWHWKWEHRRDCKSGYSPGNGFSSRWMALDVSSYDDAISGTAFEDVLCDPGINGTEANNWIDKITLVDKATRYPCIEYMFRLGLNQLAKEVIDKNCGNKLNLRGKTAKKVLRLTDDQWSEVKGKHLNISIDTLEAAAFAKRMNWRVGMEMCMWMGYHLSLESDTDYLQDSNLSKPEILKVFKYIRRKVISRYDYRDYIKQLQKLGMPLDKNNLYPNDFDELHTRYAKRIGYLRDKEKDVLIANRMRDLGEYCFSAYGLVLRPMTSSTEIIEEGTALCHCVGSYVHRYAQGDTVLCALRNEAEAGTPLYTVEFSAKGHRVQCRGYQNRTDPRDEERLSLFWTLYEAMRPEMKRQIEKGKKDLQKERKAA